MALYVLRVVRNRYDIKCTCEVEWGSSDHGDSGVGDGSPTMPMMHHIKVILKMLLIFVFSLFLPY